MLTAIAVLLLTAANNSAADIAAGDYDGDGKSDLAVVLVNRAQGQTAWLARLNSGATPYFWTFGVPGDALITGKFFGDGKVYPGVVFVRDARKPLEWYIKNTQGLDVALNYGMPGDTIPNLGDLDCDGITDLVAIRNGSSSYFPGYRLWYVSLSGSGGAVLESVFGLTSDGVATGDVDGDGCSEMIALRGGFTWYTKKLFSPEIGVAQWGLPGDVPLLPQDINGDGRPDYIISRPTGAGQVAYIRYSNNSWDTRAIGGDNSIPMVGKFNDRNDFAWWERSTGFAATRNPDGSPNVFAFGVSSNALVRPDGTVIQPDQNGRFGTPSSGGGGSSSGGGSSNNGTYNCTEMLQLPDGRANNKINANNSRHALKVIFISDLAGRIRDVKAFANGVLYDDFHEMGYEYGSRPWWNSDRGINEYSSSQPVMIVAYLSDGGQACMYVKNPSVTTD